MSRLLTFKERKRMRRQLREWRRETEWTCDANYYEDQEYISYVSDIFEHPVFQSMINYIQHGETTTRAHCIQVSYLAYTLAKMLHMKKISPKSAARAGLLHDLFLYDWHTYKPAKGERLHGFTHAKTAHDKAILYFELNPVERNSILRHMFPLTIMPPRYAEGWLICYADKYCSIYEMAKDFRTAYFKKKPKNTIQ